jgi:gliding motility-associated-like protein
VDICTGKLNLKNQSENTQQTFWNFGDGHTSIEKLPKHVYLKDGAYDLTLISDRDSICSDTFSKKLKVEINNLDKLHLFNVFTPDKEDEINRYFKLDGLDENCFELEMKIYNRWGEMVYESNDLNSGYDGWDGKKKSGEYFPSGSYFVIYHFTNKLSGEENSISGTVTLIKYDD